MGISEGYAFATSAWGSDRFDLVESTIEYIRKLVRESEIPVEIVPGGEDLGPFGKSASYMLDRKQAIMDELDHASELIREVCQVCQRTLAEIP